MSDSSTMTPVKATRISGAFAIEIAGSQNEQLIFQPRSGERLRGRWTRHNLEAGAISEWGLLKMPDIPGQLVTVDVNKKKAKIQDPLAFKENENLLREAVKVYKTVFNQDARPKPDIEVNLTEDGLATWLYWMMRYVNDGSAIIKQGQAFTLDDLKLTFPGARVSRDLLDPTSYGKGAEAIETLVA